MIGYVTLGTTDLKRAADFYDRLFEEIGADRVMEGEKYIAWAQGPGKPMVCVMYPFNGQPATVGNGTMVALEAGKPAKVDALYQRAIGLGAADEGAPGFRGEGFYAAYCRDPDGNKLCFFHM